MKTRSMIALLGWVFTLSIAAEAKSTFFTDMTVQDDGSVVLASADSIIRLKENGAVDTSFQPSLKSCSDIKYGLSEYRLKFLPGLNKVFATASDFKTLVALLLDPSGKLDSSFNKKGCLLTGDENNYNFARQIAQQTKEKVLVASEAEPGLHVSRFNIDGTEDSSFKFENPSLKARLRVEGMAVRTDESFVISYGEYGSSGTTGKIYLANFLADGQLDKQIGDNGIQQIEIKDSNRSYAANPIALADNTIVLGVTTSKISKTSLVKLNRDGNRDNTFKGLPVKSTNYVYSVAKSDKGEFFTLSIPDTNTKDGCYPSELTKFDAKGNPSKSFGKNGAVSTYFNCKNQLRYVSVDSKGRILVAGDTISRTPEHRYLATVARFLPNGRLDKSFAKDGAFRLHK